ncbi:TPR-like protein [Schizopora paradoxa]|uniref:TPR-like protein n=1 Tax=Schizopora paradoxa TaxID=27342 RepID=A0A0H2R606_9AGAM|nr:TPR-like protein [Schizopora paradoxa]
MATAKLASSSHFHLTHNLFSLTTLLTVNMAQSDESLPSQSHVSSSSQGPDKTASAKNLEPGTETHSTEIDSESDVNKCLDDAEFLKQEGTAHFKAGSWAEALASYRSGLGRLPKRREVKTKQPARNNDSEVKKDEEKEETEGEGEEPLTGQDLEVAKLRSVLNANIGACHVKLGENKDAVKACTDALLDDPTYVKALQRRASCSEQLNTWSSLVQAQDDYQTLLKVLPSDSPLRPSINRSLASVKPRLEAAQQKETGEMIGKLKEMGNSFLGNFGLSTDNFKFEPNGQGGYSMNFGR